LKFNNTKLKPTRIKQSRIASDAENKVPLSMLDLEQWEAYRIRSNRFARLEKRQAY
jgi:hypothetical protein